MGIRLRVGSGVGLGLVGHHEQVLGDASSLLGEDEREVVVVDSYAETVASVNAMWPELDVDAEVLGYVAWQAALDDLHGAAVPLLNVWEVAVVAAVAAPGSALSAGGRVDESSAVRRARVVVGVSGGPRRGSLL
jgi:hypothetical protein